MLLDKTDTITTPHELSAAHRHMLEVDSAISADVIRARGYVSVNGRHDPWLTSCRLTSLTSYTPGLFIPLFNVHGTCASALLRPDKPHEGRKYIHPMKTEKPVVLDVHPSMTDRLTGEGALVITEGVRKGDAFASQGVLAIALLGVDNWQSGGVALEDWAHVNLKGRHVYLAFDSDAHTNANVGKALERLEAFLKGRGARVHRCTFEPAPDGAKVGADDFFAAGHTATEFFELAGAPSARARTNYAFVEEMNERFVYLTGAHVYAEEAKNAFGEREFVFHRKDHMLNNFANKSVPVVVNDTIVKKNKFVVWNAHEDRRELVNLDYRPDETPEECEARGYLNLWRGYNVPTSYENDGKSCPEILEHIRVRIANGDERIANALLDILAFHVQKPAEKIPFVIVLRGKQGGAGRTLLFRYLERIYGSHALRVDDQHGVIGNFNARLAARQIVFVEEAIFAGDLKAEQRFKTLVSEPTLLVEPKGREAYLVGNFALYFETGNLEHVAHVDAGGRRHFIIDNIERRMTPSEAKAFVAEMRGDTGPAAFLSYLRYRPLPANFDHTTAPVTKGLSEERLHSQTVPMKFLFELLHSGSVLFHDDGAERMVAWPALAPTHIRLESGDIVPLAVAVDALDVIRDDQFVAGVMPKEALYRAYLVFCAKQRGYRVETNAEFFKRLRKPFEERGVPLVYGEVHRGKGGRLGRYVYVPSLTVARRILMTAEGLGPEVWRDAVTAEDLRLEQVADDVD